MCVSLSAYPGGTHLLALPKALTIARLSAFPRRPLYRAAQAVVGADVPWPLDTCVVHMPSPQIFSTELEAERSAEQHLWAMLALSN
jgi:hypothetical protein